MKLDYKVRLLETLDDATNMITLGLQSKDKMEQITLLNAAQEYIEEAKKLVLEEM